MHVLGSHSRSYLGTADEVVAVLAGAARTLVVIVGQSNATTQDLSSNLSDASLASPYANVPYISKQAFAVTDDPPLWVEQTLTTLRPVTFNSGTRCGFDLTLMRDLDRALPNGFACVRALPIGGASSVALDPSGTYPVNESPKWFAQHIAYVQAAKTAMGCSRIVYCFQHGEADSRTSPLATAYTTWLGTFVDAVRAALGGTIGFCYARVNANLDTGTYIFRDTMRTSQAAFASARTNVTMVDMDSVTLASGKFDGVHYTANGYADVGHLYSPAVAAYCGLTIPPLSSFTTAMSNLVVTFTDTSIAPGSTVTAWLWDFGDSTTSTAQNPVKTYSASGTYAVTLRTTNGYGQTNTSAAVNVTVANLAVTRDATSNKYVPADGTEFAALLTYLGNPLATPNSLWNCQEASGNAADSIGALTLTAANTPTYQQALSGWTRKAFGFASGSANKFAGASGVGPSPATTSVLWMWLVDPTAVPAAVRQIAAIGGGSASFDMSARVDAAGHPSVRCVGVSQSGTSDFVTGGAKLIFLQYDRTNAIARLITPDEIVTTTYSASVADGFKGVGGGGGGTAAASLVGYGAMWSGANAQVSSANIRTLMQGMGWTVAW